MYIPVKERYLVDDLYYLDNYNVITNDVVEWLDKLTKSTNHILGEQDGNEYKMHCTYCGQDYSVDKKPKLKQKLECPHCHEKFEYHRKKYSHTATYQYVYFTILQKIGGVIYSRYFTATKRIHYTEFDYRFSFNEVKRKRIDNGWTLRYSSTSGKLIPEHPERPREKYCYYRSDYEEERGWLYPVGIKEMFENTEYKYSAIEYIAGNPVNIKPFEYIKGYLKHPMKERLAKMGFYNLAFEFDGRTSNIELLHILLKLDKSKRILFGEYDISFDEIKCAINCECETLEELEIATNSGLNHCYSVIRKFVSKSKLYEYLKLGNNCGLYKDYLVWCNMLGENMSDKKILFPKKLKKAHDEKMNQFNVVKDEIISKKIHEYANELSLYKFENESLIIRPATSQEELIEESKELCHCVKSYSEKVAKKETSIFFVRSKKKPTKPLVTVELKNGTVIQVRAKNNNKPKKSISNFVCQWEKKFSLQGY